jgi:hypothetical protein
MQVQRKCEKEMLSSNRLERGRKMIMANEREREREKEKEKERG